ncbi:urease accessory protein UreD [Bacillus weihaiensis]|uniref:Urease accessory protein UreD n=1 Tax=Bacillus weihaiensis TaxID=1547283 RepID=A0A1L3MQ78_9BACI|nr:urease accessory protein UreD [Bacillus weihaiensis]APH04500.1 hypothetical protein A9C19_06910 [Bacillus weihaiensis]
MVYTGYLALEVGKKRERSFISSSFFDGVFKITRPTYLVEDLPLLTMIHVGGGYIDGDTYRTEITMKNRAKLALTTQASTKVYKSMEKGVSQENEFHLGEKCELYLKQDPLILYKNARFMQDTTVHLTDSSVFYFTDIISPGWSPDGLPFQYERLQSKMKIYVNESLQIIDHLLLEPSKKIDGIMQLEGYSHIGSLIYIHEKIEEKMIQELYELLIRKKKIRVGISLLPIKGLTIRVLASNSYEIEGAFNEVESFIFQHLYDKEPIHWRKS